MNNDGKKATSSNSGARFRNWACVVYPESAPKMWQSMLEELHVACLISPLHDKDLDPTGQLKKAHWHVMLVFDGKKSKEQVESLMKSFGGVGCLQVNSLRQYARYLCHLDNPDKYKYRESDVRGYGLDYFEIISSCSDKYQAIRDICDYCRAEGIFYYNILFDFCAENREDWFRILCDSGTYVIKEYLKSMQAMHNQNRM